VYTPCTGGRYTYPGIQGGHIPGCTYPGIYRRRSTSLRRGLSDPKERRKALCAEASQTLKEKRRNLSAQRPLRP